MRGRESLSGRFLGDRESGKRPENSRGALYRRAVGAQWAPSRAQSVSSVEGEGGPGRKVPAVLRVLGVEASLGDTRERPEVYENIGHWRLQYGSAL